jgi:hypothetical protein
MASLFSGSFLLNILLVSCFSLRLWGLQVICAQSFLLIYPTALSQISGLWVSHIGVLALARSSRVHNLFLPLFYSML